MGHVAVFTVPAHGHVNPTLGVVAELVRRGHRVTYVTGAEFASRVEAVGARLVPYVSSLSAAPRSADPTFDSWVVLEHATTMLPQAEALYREDPPDFVLHDYVAWAGRALAARHAIPAAELHSTFAGAAAAFRHPRLGELARHLRSYLTREAIDAASWSRAGHLHIVFLPRAFQYEGETFGPNFVFVGSGLEGRATAAWHPPASGRPVLFISLGTLFNLWPEFFRLCLSAFAGSSYHVVLSTGGGIDPASLGPLPDHFEVGADLPQLAILEHAAVFVGQGGMNGVIEALHFGVPQVAIPQTPEQEPTARRIAELGLGRHLAREETTAAALCAAVAAVDGDAGIRARVAVMREHVRSGGGAVRAADAIEAHWNSGGTPSSYP